MGPVRIGEVTSREVITVLEGLGFQRHAFGGTSHFRFVHTDGRRCTVPSHSHQDIGRGLLHKILRDAHLSNDEFENLL
jgi:predicted RNA binding protein YcfA (HicA-like mRNA interferase family)